MPVLTFFELCTINLDYRLYNFYDDRYRFLASKAGSGKLHVYKSESFLFVLYISLRVLH